MEDLKNLKITSNINDIEDSSIEVLYKLITSIYEANKKTIEEIENTDISVNHFKYQASPDISEGGLSCKFDLEVIPVVVSFQKLVSDWRKELDIINIFDIFNLKIAYAGRTYDDLKRLNREMFDGVERYNMFYDDDSKKGCIELKKFVQNFRIIQKHINDVHSLSKDQTNKSQEIEAILWDANMKILEAAGVGCRYQLYPGVNLEKIIMKQGDLCKWLNCTVESFRTTKYRASVDGFGAANFHGKCDGVDQLLIVIQSDKDYVFGGYTGGAKFNSSGQYITPAGEQPFIFSLISPSGTQPMKFDLINATSALYGHSSSSATFGGGHDIHICNNANVTVGSYLNSGHTYKMPPGGAHMFTGSQTGWLVKEIVAYQINKKQ